SQIVAAITDTDPLARPDTAAVTEDTVLQATGNVIAGTGIDSQDTLAEDPTRVTAIQAPGAPDGTPVPESGAVTVQGAYGDLAIDAGGNYTYTLAGEGDPRYDAVQALGADAHPTEVFTYTLADQDGDASTTTLTSRSMARTTCPRSPSAATMAPKRTRRWRKKALGSAAFRR